MENKRSGGENLLAREMYKETRESGRSRHSEWLESSGFCSASLGLKLSSAS